MDILTRLGERFRFADLERERYDVDGQPVSVVTPATLFRMKHATVRPIDQQDAARSGVQARGQVTRYRDVSEMPAPPARAGYTHVKQLWQFASRLVPPLYPPVVVRFRSIEDSQAAREKATIERMRRMRAARGR